VRSSIQRIFGSVTSNGYLSPVSSYAIYSAVPTLVYHRTHPFLFKQNPVFISGIITVFNMLQNKRAGLPMDQNADLLQLATAMEILKFAESR
jgi:hypothetical protein